MTTKVSRKIVKIDEEKCNGCGVCVPACVEGALQIINGKARLISETYCDGLGACLGECPQGAITIEERESQEFDEAAVSLHHQIESQLSHPIACNCPSAAVAQFEEAPVETEVPTTHAKPKSTLRQWPVQLTLVPPTAPFLKGADLVLAADCVPFAYASFHQDFLQDHALLIGCPKLDDSQAYLRKLTDILRQSQLKSLTVVHMEVPCCFGLVQLAKLAIRASGQNIPFREVTIGVRGEVADDGNI